jgi:hypothetical protein
MVVEVREALSVHKNSPAKLVEQLSMKKLIEGNVSETIILKSETVLQLWKI